MTRLLAPAKLTLSLAVTGVRTDGYHELRSEMVSLSLADELTFTEGGSGLTLVAEAGTRAESLGDERDNLITRALEAVGRRAAVHVVKRIPLGGGLGGGSTDAAAVLRWAGCTDPDVARALGSDVPFSVVGGRALVEGTGETVTPLEFEPPSLPPRPPSVRGRHGEGLRRVGRVAGTDRLPRTGQRADHGGAHGRAETGPVARRPARGGAVLSRRWPGADPPGSSRWRPMARPPTPWLTQGDERARLVRAHTVPAGWDGS